MVRKGPFTSAISRTIAIAIAFIIVIFFVEGIGMDIDPISELFLCINNTNRSNLTDHRCKYITKAHSHNMIRKAKALRSVSVNNAL